MKTVLLLLRQEFKPAATRIATEDEKRKTARNPTRRDGWEAGCPVSFFFPKGALTHHLRNAQQFGGGGIPTGWYPPNRAVRSARRISFSAENDGRCGLRSSRPRSCRRCPGQRIPELSGMLRCIAPPDTCCLQNLSKAGFANLWAYALRPIILRNT